MEKEVDDGDKGLILEKYSLSNPTYDTTRSALSHLYRVSATDMPHDFVRNLSQFVGGMKWTVEKERKDGGQKVEEGKAPMSFEVYHFSMF